MAECMAAGGDGGARVGANASANRSSLQFAAG